MKEKCPVFDIECGYISTCYNIREDRCLESMRSAGVEDLPPEDATWREKEVWMTGILKEKREKNEKKNAKINIFRKKKLKSDKENLTNY